MRFLNDLSDEVGVIACVTLERMTNRKDRVIWLLNVGPNGDAAPPMNFPIAFGGDLGPLVLRSDTPVKLYC